MSSLKSIKEAQQLTGRIAALSRFLPAPAMKCPPLFKLLRHREKILWDEACEKAFQELKDTFANPPVVTRPNPGKPLIVYLSITNEALSGVLIKENEKL